MPSKSCFGNPLPLSLKVPALGLPLFYGSNPLVTHLTEAGFTIKRPFIAADTHHMIISDEQVRLVVEYLHTPDAYQTRDEAISLRLAPPELVDRVVSSLRDVPDVRADRVEQARTMLAHEIPGADEVAGKLIGRVLSDSIR